MSASHQQPPPTVIRVVKKVKGHGGHHGGSWKVAYADFVTAMMAFFLVMWIMGMEQNVKDMVQGYFNNPIGFRKAQSAGRNILSVANAPTNMNVDRLVLMSKEAQVRKFEAARDAIRKKLDGTPELQDLSRQIDILITDEGLRIEMVENAEGETFFPFGSARLNPAAVRILDLMAPELDQLGNGIIIEGHTDAVPYSRKNYTNWDLSSDRAQAARRELESAGYRASKVLEVRGYADRNLRVPDRPTDPRNRRTTLLLPFRTDTLPSVEIGWESSVGAPVTTTIGPSS